MNKIIFYSILLTFLLSSSKSLGGSSSRGPIIFNATQSGDVTIVEFSVSNSSLEYPVKGEIQWSDDFKNPNATINQMKLSSTDLKKNQTKLPEILIDGTLLRLWVEYSNGSSETSVEFKFDCSASEMNCSVNGSAAKSLFGKKDDNNDVVIIVVIFIAAVTCLVLYVIYANSNSSSSRISTKQLGFDRRRTRRPLLIDNDEDTNNPISV